MYELAYMNYMLLGIFFTVHLKKNNHKLQVTYKFPSIQGSKHTAVKKKKCDHYWEGEMNVNDWMQQNNQTVEASL